MADKNILQQKLNSIGSKNIIVSQTDAPVEHFIQKINSLFKTENVHKSFFKHFTFYEVHILGYLPCLYIKSPSVELFIKAIRESELKWSFLSEFSCTFLSPTSALQSNLKLFGEVIGIKKKKYTYSFQVKLIEMSCLKKSDMELYIKKSVSVKKRIFIIKKTKKRKKDFSNKKIIIKMNKGDGTREVVLQNSFNPNSLISISNEVKQYLKEKKVTTSNEVTNYIVNLLDTKTKTQNQKNVINMSFKNIQRRVYDAINVMSSIGVITKDNDTNKLIYYKAIKENAEKTLLKKIEKEKIEISKKKEILINKIAEINLQQLLVKQNKKWKLKNESNDKIHLPFMIWEKEKKDKTFNIIQNSNSQKWVAYSQKEIRIICYDEIIKRYTFLSNKDGYKEICKNVLGKEGVNYLEINKINEKYYENIKREYDIKYNLSNDDETDKHTVFDVDFNCLNNTNMTSNESHSVDKGMDIDDKDYSINASTNLYSRLSMI